MKIFFTLIAMMGLAAMLVPAPQSERGVLILGGDTDGYLSPCGCTKPMSGGVRRRMAMIRQLARGRVAMTLENGNLIAGSGRQDELKAEAMAEALNVSGVDAIRLGPNEAKLGAGMVLALDNLAPGKLLLSTVAETPRWPIQRFASKGPFLAAGISSRSTEVAASLGERDLGVDAAVRDLLAEAKANAQAAVLLTDENLEGARSLARRFPGVALIQYRSTAAPASQPLREGSTWLVSPGEKGKHVLFVEWDGKRLTRYRVFQLFEEVKDDPPTTRVYQRYLQRVTNERLLDQLPRFETERFAGNKACGSCHTDAMKVWEKSAHAGALGTLQKDKHHRDPDCVSCHVVGLDSVHGFRSEDATPQLKNVGCESCHGPGANHAAAPLSVKMPKIGERSCMPCHVKNHSPNFNFPQYWRKIAH